MDRRHPMQWKTKPLMCFCLNGAGHGHRQEYSVHCPDQVNSPESSSMYQVLWSASVCQLSHLPCMKYFGLPVSVSWATFHVPSTLGLPVSVSWVTFHVPSTLVCQCLSAELPSMYQVLWSASVCQLSYLPCIKYFGLPVSVSWVTFHVPSTLVCQCLSAELPSMYQVLWSASVCQLSLPSMYQVLWSASGCQLSHLPCIKYFGLPVSVSWVTFHVSSTLVCQCLSAEVPSMYQVLWCANFCQLPSL